MSSEHPEQPPIWRARHNYRRWRMRSPWRILAHSIGLGLLVYFIAAHSPLWLILAYLVGVMFWAAREAARASREAGYWEARTEMADSLMRAIQEGASFAEWAQRDIDTTVLRAQYGRRLRWWQL